MSNSGSWHRQHHPVTSWALSVTAYPPSEFISQMMPTWTNSVRLSLKCETNLVTICLYRIKLHCPALGLAVLPSLAFLLTAFQISFLSSVHQLLQPRLHISQAFSNLTAFFFVVLALSHSPSALSHLFSVSWYRMKYCSPSCLFLSNFI